MNKRLLLLLLAVFLSACCTSKNPVVSAQTNRCNGAAPFGVSFSFALANPKLLDNQQGYAPADLSAQGTTFVYEQMNNEFHSINYSKKPVKIQDFCFLDASFVSGKINFKGFELFNNPQSIKISWYSPSLCEVADIWSRKYFTLQVKPANFLKSFNTAKRFLNTCNNCNTTSVELMNLVLEGNLRSVSDENGWHVFAAKARANEAGFSILYREKLGRSEVIKASSSLALEQLDMYDGK